jgi:hypothetical protein
MSYGLGRPCRSFGNEWQADSQSIPGQWSDAWTECTKTYAETVAYEGRLPDKVFKVFVPNDKAFDDEVRHQISLKSWDWHPNNEETNCSVGIERALEAGGVPASLLDIDYVPDDLEAALEEDSSMTRGANQQWSVTPVQSNVLSLFSPLSKNDPWDPSPWLFENAFGTMIVRRP